MKQLLTILVSAVVSCLVGFITATSATPRNNSVLRKSDLYTTKSDAYVNGVAKAYCRDNHDVLVSGACIAENLAASGPTFDSATDPAQKSSWTCASRGKDEQVEATALCIAVP